MRKNYFFFKSLLLATVLLLGSANAWGDDWTTVWSADFASTPSGMTYSVTNGSTDITNGYIHYNQGGGSGNRAINTAFTASAFNVTTNWKMEFDWSCGSANTNTSYVTFATDKGNAFTLTWEKYASGVVVTDAAANELSTTVPLEGYNKHTCSSWSHIIITGNTENGIYLTITKGETKYVDNVLVTSTFGYPKTFNGSLGKNVSAMFVDNVTFATPKVAGFVATPTSEITGAFGTNRKFTLSCLTDGATIYYATSDLEKGAAGWNTYIGEVTTDAATIYSYAKDDEDNTSDKMNFATGAGTTISLATPAISATGFSNTAGISVTNPTFNFTCDNSAVLGKPTATLTYTFTPDGGVESSATVGTSYTPTAYGTLKVIASADGYDSSEKTLTVSSLYNVYYTGRDYSTATTSDAFATFGEAAEVTWAGWTSGLTSNLLTSVVSDDRHMNISNANTIDLVNGWGLVRYNKSYGYRVRYAKEGDFIALKYNTSKGSDASANSYNTTYCTSGTGKITDLVTVSIDASGAVQQLYHYSASPTTVSATVSAAGFATLYSAYALDFEHATPAGLKAYTATLTDETVTLTEVRNVTAETGVVLKGAAGTYNIPVLATSTIEKGDLTGNVSAPTAFDAFSGYDIYGLAMNGENAQFKKITSGSVAAGKAFLKVSNATPSKALRVVVDGQVTEITAPEVVETEEPEVLVNLAGIPVGKDYKGIVINQKGEKKLQK